MVATLLSRAVLAFEGIVFATGHKKLDVTSVGNPGSTHCTLRCTLHSGDNLAFSVFNPEGPFVCTDEEVEVNELARNLESDVDEDAEDLALLKRSTSSRFESGEEHGKT